ncbi:MAG TPA: GH116 family glycosyl-hydrolase [Vicinamibacteria bacterium]|nr:GH116 family glycosyl-hydrolase [Vicinamibacteria bacterium]
MERRDVLKLLSAAPFIGLGRQQAANRAPRYEASAGEHVWRVFEEPFLSEIGFPLGGIGTGTVSLGGRGQLRDWEVMNEPNKGGDPENTFFALWFQADGWEPKTMLLESELTPPYRGAFGIPRAGMPGMPRFQRGRFLGSYPFARVELMDERVPLDVSLECFNPFIPGNDKDSGLPLAVFYWHLTNRHDGMVRATVMGSLQNSAGGDVRGGNVNAYRSERSLKGISMETTRLTAEDRRFGSLVLATLAEETTFQTRWTRGEWFDAQSLFWDDFGSDGRLEPVIDSDESPEGKTDVGSIGGVVRLAAGETATIPFFIAWHFPNRQNYWVNEIFGYEPNRGGPIIGNYYGSLFEDAWAVATYAAAELPRLERDTRLFHDALFSTTAPTEILDAVSSQMSIIRTNTCFRASDGNFYAFEGTGDDHGCCPLNCTHVWNYEQALAFLFPALERTMRDVDFDRNTDASGFMVFRTRVPLETEKWDFPHAAADGQMGTIVKLYREWQLSGDLNFLKRHWPKAKRALEFAWTDWDPDRDGVMEGVQHNTYDIEFRGPNPMMGAIYLTALRCASVMARAVGDESAATRYRDLEQNGRRLLDEETWNGEFYVQAFERAREEKYQVGAGCLSDQMLGQWMAHVVGMGYVLPEEHVRSAIRSVHRYNFKETLHDHSNPQRIFALGDEAGLLLCTWPRGSRPLLPFVYSDEVWTGIEYQVAAHLIYEGMVDEGLRIVRAVRSRYDGERRNPWNEVECGNHYARALASWSLLLALSGFRYSGPERAIAFSPKIEQRRFVTFWSAGPGWGIYEQERSQTAIDACLRYLYGDSLTLEQVSISVSPGPESMNVRVTLTGSEIPADTSIEDGTLLIRLRSAVEISPGSALRIQATT